MSTTNLSPAYAGSGHQIFAFKSFWPAALVEVSATGGSILIPDQLWLIEGDRIMIQIGQLPAFPVVVKAASNDWVSFAFVDAVHPTVVAAISGDEGAVETRGNAAHAQMACAA